MVAVTSASGAPSASDSTRLKSTSVSVLATSGGIVVVLLQKSGEATVCVTLPVRTTVWPDAVRVSDWS